MTASADSLPVPVNSNFDESRGQMLRDALARTIERIAQVIDLETECLRSYQPIDLISFNHQKSHGLLELTRAIRAVPAEQLDNDILLSLGRLRDRLEKNQAVLNIHLKAVRQVSSLIAKAIEDDNSDGTYSAVVQRPGRSS